MLFTFFLAVLFCQRCEGNIIQSPIEQAFVESASTLADDAVKIILAAVIEETPFIGGVIDTLFSFFNNWLSASTECAENCVWSEIEARVARTALNTDIQGVWSAIQTKYRLLNASLGLAYANCSAHASCPGINVGELQAGLGFAKEIQSDYALYLGFLRGNLAASCTLVNSMGVVGMSHVTLLRSKYNISVQLRDAAEIDASRLELKTYFDAWMSFFEECYCSTNRSAITPNMVCDAESYLVYRANHLPYTVVKQEACVTDLVDDANICPGNIGLVYDYILPNTVTARLNEIRTGLVSSMVPFLTTSKLVFEYASDPMHFPYWYNCGSGVNRNGSCPIQYICVTKDCWQVYNGPGVALGPYGTGLGHIFGNQNGDN
jgi:hypothetical protein